MNDLAQRALAALPVLLGVSLLVFSMLQLVPGDPVRLMLSEFQTTPEQVERLRSQLHLDDPLPVQFGRFVWNASHGDLGTSIRTRRPVAQEIADNLPSTLQLAVAGLVVAAALGVSLGIVAAVKQHSWMELASMLECCFTAATMPSETPKAAATTRPTTASCSVEGRLSAISCATGRRVRIEVPRSPWEAFHTKRPNCTGSGSSR